MDERRINPILLNRLTIGDLLPLLDYVKSDRELRLEVRRQGKAIVYYRKGKALEIRAGGRFFVDNKYAKYGKIPQMDLVISDPVEYFKQMKLCIDSKPHPEFDLQQDIATSNQDKNDKYLILDMKYSFSQSEIPVNAKVNFDLVGIERQTGKVVFFKIKKGLGSLLKGNTIIKKHIDAFETYL
jgi:hypothetical protein